MPSFKKNFCLTKNGGHFEFSNILQQLQSTKMLISRKAVLDKAISMKFYDPQGISAE